MTASHEHVGDAVQVDTVLRQRYLDALDPHELAALAAGETAGRLSGLFLPAASDAYLESKVRVMLIGQEPKGWGTSLQTFATGERTRVELDTYVRAQMDVYRRHASAKSAGPIKFLQFRKALRIALRDSVAPGPDSVHWGNLFCVSLNKGSPSNAACLDTILAISKKLLDVQFGVLQPDLVVFGTGPGYDTFLKHHLAGRYTTLEGKIPLVFWPFKVDNPGFLGWRVRHPRRVTRLTKRDLIGALQGHANVIAATHSSATPALPCDEALAAELS